METLECKKCHTKTNSKFCPNCGAKMFTEPRSVEEIKYQLELIKKAGKIDKEAGLMSMVLTLMIDMVLAWTIGESEMTPTELIIHGEGEKNPQLKAILEAAKLGLARKE